MGGCCLREVDSSGRSSNFAAGAPIFRWAAGRPRPALGKRRSGTVGGQRPGRFIAIRKFVHETAIEIAPKTFAPYEALWEVYLSGGQTAKAEQVLEKAARSKSTDPDFWLSLAELSSRNVLRDAGASLSEVELQRVGRLLEKAAACGEKDPAALSKIGDLYVLTRQTDKALPFYRKVVDLKPSYPQIREKLAGCLVETGQTGSAIEVIEDLVAGNPLSVSAYDQLTQLYLKAGHQQKALASARQALLIEPQMLPRHLQVIDLLFKQ
jgi:predicted Zn-dependent protease